ncbi:hypothetical protein ACVWXO_005956 [Bradyrhizobium sp. LM2.7]
MKKNVQLYDRVDNVFDRRCATYGQFFDRSALPDFVNGGADLSDPRSLSLARPRGGLSGDAGTFEAQTSAISSNAAMAATNVLVCSWTHCGPYAVHGSLIFEGV